MQKITVANSMKTKSKKHVGIYGGTFDPPHLGHLNLAIQMREIHKLDEILFCPVQVNPHKQNQLTTPFEHRLEMLKLCLLDVPHCSITEIESEREGPSYTIDTLNILMSSEAEDTPEYSLIMGDDAIPGFFRWHKPEEIVKRVPLLIGRRLWPPFDISTLTQDSAINDAIRRGMTNTRVVDICSTEIRQRISEGLYCGHLVPEKVLDYIYENALY